VPIVVDVICAAVLIVFALLGAWRGFVRQTFSLVAFALIALVAAPLGVWMADRVVRAGAWAPGDVTDVRIGFSLGVAVGVYIVVKLIGAWVGRVIGRRRPEKDRTLAPWRRYWGAALGIVKAGVLCWLVLCFLAACPQVSPGAAGPVKKSWAARTVGLYNPFDRWIVSKPFEEAEKDSEEEEAGEPD